MVSSIKHKISNFSKSKFVKDTFTLQISSVFIRVLSIIASIVFARILGASEFGVYALVFGLVSLMSIFMSVEGGGVVLVLLPQAYARQDRKEINNIISYFIKVSFITALLIGLIMVVIAPTVAKLMYDQVRIGYLAQVVILGVILTSFSSALTLSLQAIRKIKILAVLETGNRVLESLLPIILVLLGFGLTGIVWGHFIINFIFFIVSLVVYYIWTMRNKHLPKYSEIFQNIFRVKIKRYLNFGLLMLLDRKIATIYTTLPIVLLGMFVPSAVVGYFKIAIRFMSLVGTFTKPIARLLTVQLPKSLNESLGKCKKLFFKVSVYTPIFTLPVIIVFLLIAPYVIRFFYGLEYEPAISLVYYLSITSVLASFGIGIGSFYRATKTVGFSVIMNTIIVIFGLPLVYYFIKNFQLMGAVWVYILWSLPSYIGSFIYIYNLKSVKEVIEEPGI